uniref:Uncharacterized protein n=1 Tax=Balaenoptera musculus TaxID=9771 RepID=A0A8C0CB50_BALMU
MTPKGMSSLGKRHSKVHTLCCLPPSEVNLWQMCAKAKRQNITLTSMDSVKEQHLNPRGQLLQHTVHLMGFNG